MPPETMAAAYDAGVNFFDNAEVYAKGESRKIMAEAPATYRLGRSSLYVVSTSRTGASATGPNEKNTLNRKYLRGAIDGWLRASLGSTMSYLAFCHRAILTCSIG